MAEKKESSEKAEVDDSKEQEDEVGEKPAIIEEANEKEERITINQRIANYFTPERKRFIYTVAYFVFLAAVVGLFIYFKIQLAISPPPTEIIDYSEYEWYLIPYLYIINYIKNAWYSLILAFLLAGIIYEFIPNKIIKKWLGGGKFHHYLLAAALAPLFITCSCSVYQCMWGYWLQVQV
jgi:hypothetical protein